MRPWGVERHRWHGLADPHISPANTVSYHEGLIDQMGAETVDGFVRLYLLPGVSHCGNGKGPSNLDLLSAAMAWVEQGTAPDAIMTTTASETSSFGQPDFTGASSSQPHGAPTRNADELVPMARPVYPYPNVAEYDGVGDVTAAGSWSKGGPAEVVALRKWAGIDLFRPYSPIE